MTSPTSPPRIVVVGAGAAGLVAAIFAARGTARTGEVLLLESTRDGGRKILVSGGGRCNVLPSQSAPERFVTDSSSNTLRKMLRAWPLGEQRSFFEREVGVPLSLEAESGKLFPTSNRARDVRDGLLRLAEASGVRVRTAARVLELRPGEGEWRIALEGETLTAARVVLATGGLSMPGTGSDGAGFAWLRALGHIVRTLYPALVPLVAQPAVHVDLAGIARSVVLRAPGAPVKIVSAEGGFLFTHRGYSGPAVLDLSHLAVRSRMAGGPRQALTVQWTVEEDAKAWDEMLRGASGTVGGVVARRLQERLAERLLAESGVERERPLARLRREERLRLVELLTHYPLPWTGDEGYAKAEVTGGGLALGEVDARTLESKLRPGLFVCGEVLDAFGPIGGHNFSWAWATGRAAGMAAAETLLREPNR